MKIGSQIRERRKAKRWSQTTLAYKSKTSLPTVSRYERDAVPQPDEQTLSRICAALDIPFTPSVPARIGADAERGAA